MARRPRLAPTDVNRRLYTEVGAGGFSHVDGTVELYQRVRALVTPQSRVLDFGAGRGRFGDDPVAFRREIQRLRGSVARVIGVDVDAAVRNNESLDEAYVIEPDGPLPIEDESIDVVVSDWTFEHVADPARLAAELGRVLRPGGWICARTPNRRGYVALGARLVPDRLERQVLGRLRPQVGDVDTFPKLYRLNTARALERVFPEERFEHFVYRMNNEPGYVGGSVVAARAARFLFRFVPDRLGATLYVFLRKR